MTSENLVKNCQIISSFQTDITILCVTYHLCISYDFPGNKAKGSECVRTPTLHTYFITCSLLHTVLLPFDCTKSEQQNGTGNTSISD